MWTAARETEEKGVPEKAAIQSASELNVETEQTTVDVHVVEQLKRDVLDIIELHERNVSLEKCYDDAAVSSGVAVITSDISYREFFRNYLLPNLPCKISIPGCISHWQSVQEWVDEQGLPNFANLEQEFGACIVPVADCNHRFYNAHLKTEMLFSEYTEYWKKIIKANHKYESSSPCLYLKDWHFAREVPYYEAYKTPVYFSSDWLNEYLVAEATDDYRFVYMGPKGTWTPLHVDVFQSYSWSANVCGKKRWVLFPPGTEEYLKDKLGNLPDDITKADFSDVSQYPNAHKLKRNSDGSLGIEVIQHPGEVIFVPTGWHHQVWNLIITIGINNPYCLREDTISINHNWFNGCNIHMIWDAMIKSLEEVEKEISDCKDMSAWNMQCQILLKVHHGMDFCDFFHVLNSIARRVIKDIEIILQHPSHDASSSNANCPPNRDIWHSVFDLIQISCAVTKLLDHPHSRTELGEYKERAASLLEELTNLKSKLSSALQLGRPCP